MHELAVTDNLLKLALQHAEIAGATSITGLRVVMGELSSIVDDSIQFYWDIIPEHTIAAKAQLYFCRIPAEFGCQACGNRYRPAQENSSCPICASVQVKLAAGDEFFLEAIEV